MKAIHIETGLGVLLLLSVLLLATKGVEKLATKLEKEQQSKTQQQVEKEQQAETQPPAQTQLQTETQAAKYTVVVDAGHGGIDPGKVGINDSLEKDINLAIAQKLKTCLEKEGIQVVMTRETDAGLYEETDANKKRVDMSRRCKIIQEAAADLTVSIHQNSFTAESVSGPQVFYYEGSEKGEQAAATLQEALNQYLEISDPREIKSDTSYYILKKTETPVVIAECGFLSNSTEAAKLATEEYQQKIAEALTEGIVRFLDTML